MRERRGVGLGRFLDFQFDPAESAVRAVADASAGRGAGGEVDGSAILAEPPTRLALALVDQRVLGAGGLLVAFAAGTNADGVLLRKVLAIEELEQSLGIPPMVSFFAKSWQ